MRKREVGARRLRAAKLFAGRIRASDARCLLSKIRGKISTPYLHMYRDIAGYFYGALTRRRLPDARPPGLRWCDEWKGFKLAFYTLKIAPAAHKEAR